MYQQEQIVRANDKAAPREGDAQRFQELKRSGSYKFVCGYVVLYCVLSVIGWSSSTWGLSLWLAHITLHTVLLALVLLHIRSHSPDTWKYISACSQGLFDVWKVWPSMLILAMLYWIAVTVIWNYASELFPGIFALHIQTFSVVPDVKKVTLPFAYSVVEWVCESLKAGVVEELTMKLFLLLCLPPRMSFSWFMVIATILIMMAHMKYSIGAMVLIGLIFAIPTAWYFYKTRKLAHLILLHVFVDLFLMRPL